LLRNETADKRAALAYPVFMQARLLFVAGCFQF